jgi:hypothetical protein
MFDIVVFPQSGFASDEKLTEHEIGIGDELMVSGMFFHHRGTDRNLPIVRSGIIASMPHEKLIDSSTGQLFDAYLAEVRSIGGLSGSPVFAVLPPGRILGDEVKSGPRHFFLLGLIRGHYAKPADAGDDNLGAFTAKETEMMNTGIAYVTPVRELIRIFETDEVRDEIKKSDEEHAEKTRARPS